MLILLNLRIFIYFIFRFRLLAIRFIVERETTQNKIKVPNIIIIRNKILIFYTIQLVCRFDSNYLINKSVTTY